MEYRDWLAHRLLLYYLLPPFVASVHSFSFAVLALQSPGSSLLPFLDSRLSYSHISHIPFNISQTTP